MQTVDSVVKRNNDQSPYFVCPDTKILYQVEITSPCPVASKIADNVLFKSKRRYHFLKLKPEKGKLLC